MTAGRFTANFMLKFDMPANSSKGFDRFARAAMIFWLGERPDAALLSRAIGFRELTHGDFMYVDDLVCDEAERGKDMAHACDAPTGRGAAQWLRAFVARLAGQQSARASILLARGDDWRRPRALTLVH